MRGRKPTPTAQRLATGNPGKRRINREEPAPPTLEGDAVPIVLRGDAIAVAEWRRLAPMLRRSRQITEADRAGLIALCLEWSVYLTESRRARREGRVVTSGTGLRRSNPRRILATAALSQCVKLWAELGLTPTSRSRVKTEESGPGPAGDAFSEFDDPPGSAPGVGPH